YTGGPTCQPQAVCAWQTRTSCRVMTGFSHPGPNSRLSGHQPRPPIAFGVATLLTLLTRAQDLSQDKLRMFRSDRVQRHRFLQVILCRGPVAQLQRYLARMREDFGIADSGRQGALDLLAGFRVLTVDVQRPAAEAIARLSPGSGKWSMPI